MRQCNKPGVSRLTVAALIVAAGSGSRHGGDLPKQYQSLGGKPLLRHTVEAFLRHPKIDEVRVVIEGSAGEPRPATLKALVGLREGFMTEEMVIFAGPDALKRAQMTQKLLEYRFKVVKLEAQEVRFDYLGVNAVHMEASPPMSHEPYESILRVAIKTQSRAEADKLRKEVDPLAVNGVYGTGKWATSASGSRVRSVIGLSSCLVPREVVSTTVTLY